MPEHKNRNILLNKLGVKHSLLRKFGLFISYYKQTYFVFEKK